MPDLPLSPDFRSELFAPFTALLRAGESVSLLGVGSCGKSNVVRFLKREDARTLYFEQDAATTLYTPVDCYKLDDTNDVTLYAAILQMLAETAPTLGEAGKQLAPQFDAWWNEVLSTNRAPIARRRVEQALDALLNGPAKRVILLLDDCDELIAHAPLALFRSLRALRDDHKYRLVYVTVTRRELARLREHSNDFESFFELLSRHILALKPYQELDAYFMLKRLVARNAGTRPFSSEEMRNIYHVTGGHAGLISVTFEAVKNTERAQASADALLDFLAEKRVVYDESKKIWDSLEEYEQADLLAIVQGQEATEGGLPPLMKKGIVLKKPNGALEFFSPLFESFVQTELPEGENENKEESPVESVESHALGVLRLSHNLATGTLRVNGRAIQLSPVESELFAFLHKHCERGCDTNELVNVLMSVDYGGNPYGRLHMHLTRMRERVNMPNEIVLIQRSDTMWQVMCGETHGEKE